MKAHKVKSSGFVPFDLVIGIESEEEARALYAIFNYCPNTELLSDEAEPSIRATIGQKFSILPASNEIANGVSYNKFYSKKEKDDPA